MIRGMIRRMIREIRRYIAGPGLSGAAVGLTGGASLLLGGMALAGWLFHLQGLTRLGPSFTPWAIPMAATTAAGLLLDGAALLFIAAGRAKAALAGAIWSLLAGVLTLAEYGLSTDLHVDGIVAGTVTGLVGRDVVRALPAHPDRMAR